MLSVKEIGARWRANPFVEYPWKVDGQGHCRKGHSAGCIAHCDELGRNVYLKPKAPLTPRAAAHEKIASDLAHDLDVNVPPVVLTNPPPGWDGQFAVCASLVLYPFQLHWGAAKHGVRNAESISDADALQETVRGALHSDSALRDAVLRTAPVDAARAFAFDVWVNQPDHDHPSNIAWGAHSESNSSLVFFDYEMAFNTAPLIGHPPAGQATTVPFPVELLQLLDNDVLLDTVSAIETYSAASLRNIVGRIDQRWLGSSDGEGILEVLESRRRSLRSAISSVMEVAS